MKEPILNFIFYTIIIVSLLSLWAYAIKTSSEFKITCIEHWGKMAWGHCIQR